MAVDGITATYIANNQFSVAGDQTDDFHAGRRVKAELTGGYVYSTISGSVFGANTTVTLYDSELDNTLTKVWYGIGWGSEGSLPDHMHDSSEGSGAQFTSLVFLAPATIGVPDNTDLITLSSGVVTFDSPITIGNSDLGNVPGSMRWTGADLEYNDGIAWQSLTGGGGSFLARDGSTTLTGDWNFGSFTISGTGDIWCNDLHTAGSSLYIGSVQLTSAGNVLNFGANTIFGTGDMAARRVALGSVHDLVLYPETEIVIINESATYGWGVFHKYVDSSAGSAPSMHKARGTYASPAAVQAGDVVGGYNVFAYDGSTHDQVGQIRHMIESISVGNIASYIEFYVSDSSGVEQEMMRINSTGMIVGDAIDQQADYVFHVKDSSAVIGLEGDLSTSDAGIRLEKNGSTYWHIYNDADQSDRFVFSADGSSFHSLVASNTYASLGIGYTGTNQPTDNSRLTIIGEASGVLILRQYSDSSSGCAFAGQKARGSDQDSPAAVQADDIVTGYNASAYDGSTFDGVGKCRHRVESISAGDIASYWELYTSDSSGVNRQVTRVDSEGRMWISAEDISANVTTLSDWQTIVGSNAAINVLDLQDDRRPLSFLGVNDGQGGPAFKFYKGRGTSLSSPSAVQADDTLAGWNAYAYDGTTWDYVSEQKLSVESIAAGNIATYFNLDLTDSSGSKREVFRIHSSGRLELYEDGLTVDGHIYTSTSGVYDIGTLTAPFKDIYLTGGSVYLNNEQISSPSPGVIDFGGAEIQNATVSGIEAVTYQKGRQELFIEYATTSGINILPGKIDIEDGANEYALQVSGTLFKDSDSLSASTWYYIYAKPPAGGNYLSESEIELSTTAPTRDITKRGYYHGTNTDWRCFGAFYTNSNNTVTPFQQNGNIVYVTDRNINIYANSVTGGSWNTHTCDVPFGDVAVPMSMWLTRSSNDAWFKTRKKGESGNGTQWARLTTQNERPHLTITQPINSDKQFEAHLDQDITWLNLDNIGFTLPDWIAPK